MTNIDQLQENGIVITDIQIDKESLKECQNLFEALIKNHKKYGINNPNFTFLKHPLSYEPFAKIATDDSILEIVSLFFKGKDFFLGTSNLRRSHATSEPDNSTTIYHRDSNLGKIETRGNFLKVFLYLTDVDEDSGPFTYIQKSHLDYRENPTHSHNLYRVPDSLAYKHYDENNVIKCCSKAGKIIIADTTGLHKGTKVKQKHRDMFTINYCLVKEPNTEKFEVKSSFVNNLPSEKQKLFRHLKQV